MILGELIENRIIVWDLEASRRLYQEAYYGKPLGIPKPKDFNFQAPLILDLKEKFLVYTKLKEKEYIVTPGIKFGSDFAIYHKDKGPGKEHAPYLVKVMKPNEKIDSLGIVLAGRLATTVRKQFIIAIANIKNNNVDFIGFDWWRA